MSTTFDEKFEVWLNDQLQTIKLLTGFRTRRQKQQQPLPQEHSQLQSIGAESYYSTVSYGTPPVITHKSTLSAEMSRASRDVSKHGGNYYQFAYDEDDDVQSFEDVGDDNEEDDERRRRRRLSRILGDQCPDFGSETGLEMDDEMAMMTASAQPFDENRNVYGANRSDDIRANQYSTTSLEFSDADSYVSASESDVANSTLRAPRDQVDWPDGGDGYTGDGLEGFVEFSRVRDEKQRRAVDSDDEDPLQYRAKQPSTSVQPKLLSSGLIAAIAGRGRPTKKSPVDETTKSPSGRRMEDMVAVAYHKTDAATSGGELAGGDYMDDDDILVHPQHHQLPVNVSGKSSSKAAANDDEYNSAARSFLPVDLSMDIMSNDDAFSTPDFDDTSDDVGLHAKDRDPIVGTSSRPSSASPRSPKSFSLPQHIARSVSDAASDRMPRCGGKRRRLWLGGSIVVGLLLLAGISVAIFFIVRPS